MKQIFNAVRSVLLVLLLLSPSAFAASAGTSNESAKPPLYTFVVSLDIPRVHWGAMGRANEGMDKPQDASMQEGMIVGFGSNTTLTHDPKRLPTHERWCSGTSVASVLSAIDALGRSGAPNDPAVLTQTNRWDAIYVSRFYIVTEKMESRSLDV